MVINKNRAKRRGRNPLDDPRIHCISVRLNDEELAILNSNRANMKKGEWLRCAAVDRLPTVVPEPNKQKWLELAKAANNLNQVARRLNELMNIDEAQFVLVRKILNEFRSSLLGVRDERNAKD
jgi:hypothetical protein